jgi:hypothetical protein
MYEMTNILPSFRSPVLFFIERYCWRGGEICGVKRILSIQIAFPINRFLPAVIDAENRKFDLRVEMTGF